MNNISRRGALGVASAAALAAVLSPTAQAAPKQGNGKGKGGKGGKTAKSTVLSRIGHLTHPTAKAHSLPITGIGEDTAGNIQLGFGDWTANTDSWTAPVELLTFNPATGAQVGPGIRMNTESIQRFRRFNNACWWPSIDPSNPAGYKGQGGSGVWTDRDGDWTLLNNYDGVRGYDLTHVQDVAVTRDGTVYTAVSDDYKSVALLIRRRPGAVAELIWEGESIPPSSYGIGSRATNLSLSPDQRSLFLRVSGGPSTGI